MDVLFWEYPPGFAVHEEGANTRGEFISSIVQSGIKLFLHQRNQIPLPLEQLGSRLAGRQRGIIPEQGDNGEGEDESEDPRERIQKMTARRREIAKERKMIKRGLRASKQEELAHQMITDILQVLDTSIVNIYDNLLAVGLIFGPSVHSPKELIVFELPIPTSFSQQPSLSQENCRRPTDVVSVIRNFYKTIIMSEQFVELTSKSLRPTGTHVCLFSRTEVPEELRKDLILLETTTFLSQLMTSQCWSTSGKSRCQAENARMGVRPRKMAKVLRIKLGSKGNLDGSMDDDSSLNDSSEIEQDNEKVEDRDDFLLESNSFCCYQIPLRFKGVRCKNKG